MMGKCGVKILENCSEYGESSQPGLAFGIKNDKQQLLELAANNHGKLDWRPAIKMSANTMLVVIAHDNRYKFR